jgi:uncharacterized protein YnzC (UPF0291/DUF896 family)
MSQQLSKNLPKRAAKDHPSHARRARSYVRGQAKKTVRWGQQTKREMHNQSVGSTGKERDNALRKAFGESYRSVKRETQKGITIVDYGRDHRGVYVIGITGI